MRKVSMVAILFQSANIAIRKFFRIARGNGFKMTKAIKYIFRINLILLAVAISLLTYAKFSSDSISTRFYLQAVFALLVYVFGIRFYTSLVIKEIKKND